MSENETPSGGLGSTFGSKTKGSQISYGHPQSKEIMAHAREIRKIADRCYSPQGFGLS